MRAENDIWNISILSETIRNDFASFGLLRLLFLLFLLCRIIALPIFINLSDLNKARAVQGDAAQRSSSAAVCNQMRPKTICYTDWSTILRISAFRAEYVSDLPRVCWRRWCWRLHLASRQEPASIFSWPPRTDPTWNFAEMVSLRLLKVCSTVYQKYALWWFPAI